MSNSNTKRWGDGLFRVILGCAVTTFFAVYSLIEPEYKYFSIWAVMIGAVGTWGLYLAWRRKWDRHGLDLLDEDDS